MSKGMLKHPIFIGSEIYRGSSYGGLHPLRVPRVSTVMDLTRVLGWLPDVQYRTSPRAKPNPLASRCLASRFLLACQTYSSQDPRPAASTLRLPKATS